LALSTDVSILTLFSFYRCFAPLDLPSFPTRRSSDLCSTLDVRRLLPSASRISVRRKLKPSLRPRPCSVAATGSRKTPRRQSKARSEEHTSELQSRRDLVCRLLLEKKKTTTQTTSELD